MKIRFSLSFFFAILCLVPITSIAQWLPLGPSKTATYSVNYLNGCVAPDGTIYTLIRDGNSSYHLKKYELGGLNPVSYNLPNVGYIGFSDLAVSPDNVVYIAYDDYGTDNPVQVKKLTANNWEAVGTIETPDMTSGIKIRFSPQNKMPYIFYYSEQAEVKRFNGSEWENVGLSFSKTRPNYMDMEIARDGQVYVLFNESLPGSSPIKVMKFNGAQWQLVGGSVITSEYSHIPDLDISPTGVPYVIYTVKNGTSDKPVVKRLQNSAWQELSGYLTWANYDGYNTLKIIIGADETPYVSYVNSDGNNSRVLLAKHDGSDWKIIDYVSKWKAEGTKMLRGSNGFPVIAYFNMPSGFGEVVLKFDGEKVEEVIPSSISGPLGNYCHLVYDTEGKPLIIYSSNSHIYLKRYIDNKWQMYALPIKATNAANLKLVSRNNKIFLFYTEEYDYSGSKNYRPVVQWLVNGEWKLVGNKFFSNTNIKFSDMDIGPDSTPYVTYQDEVWPGKVVVRKFDGTTWVNAGGDYVSTKKGEQMQIRISDAGIPFVFFVEDTYTPVVKKLVGQFWISLKAPETGFDYLGKWNLCLELKKNGDPVIAYSKGGGNLTIKEFKSDNWIQITPNFAISGSSYDNEVKSIMDSNENFVITWPGFTTNPIINLAEYKNGGWNQKKALNTLSVGSSTSIAKDGNGNYALAYSTGEGIYAYTGTDGSLPVTIGAFNVSKQLGGLYLQWNTTNEMNNRSFELFHSTDGIQFNFINSIPGNGTSGQQHNYSYLDTSPVYGSNYYKLLQVDQNGEATVIGLKQMSWGEEFLAVKIYPNPAADILEANFKKGTFNSAQIVDINGQIVLASTIKGSESKLHIDIQKLRSGNYILLLSGDSVTCREKFIKM